MICIRVIYYIECFKINVAHYLKLRNYSYLQVKSEYLKIHFNFISRAKITNLLVTGSDVMLVILR